MSLSVCVPAELWVSVIPQFEQFEQACLQHQFALLNPSDTRFWDELGVSAETFSVQLQRAFVASEFVAKTCALHPELLMSLVERGDLFRKLDDDDIALVVRELMACESEAALDKTLRLQRQRALLRIIWRDLNRLSTMQETTAELSRFADVVVQRAAYFHCQTLEQSWGTPIGKYSNKPQPFMVLGMGKLGAMELNVSSDIDLIFTYPEAGYTNHATRSISNQEFFIKLGQKLIASLDKFTADGFVFRVDMRLRPHGESGALALSFAAMEDYYQTQGREWERYAMIKARTLAVVCGDHHDEEYLRRERKYLRTMLQPFTYRQYIDFSAIESLREMKSLIARQVQRKGMNADVKLGEGGIREIEFVVQVFQLIRGGRDKRLRERQVTKLLPLLEQEGYLPAGSGQALLEAYIFLRNTEHAIQAYQDRQTQALPTDEQGRWRLAWVMGFTSWDAFYTQLQVYRAGVNHEFRSVIADPHNKAPVDASSLHLWQEIWLASLPTQTLNTPEWEALLVGQSVTEPSELWSLLQQLRESRALVSMQASSRSRMDAFIPRLLLCLNDYAQRNLLPISLAATLKRIVPLIEAVARRSAYLVLLVENPTALEQLVKLCSASPMIAADIAKYPALLDELLSPERLYFSANNDHEHIKSALRNELRRDVLRLTWDDLEGHMEALRYFRSAYGLRVAASEVTGSLPLMKVSDYLTFIAEVILEHVLQLSWEYMVARHGYPMNDDGSVHVQPEFVIVAYGKLGGIELGHGSDLDLVFIHNADASQHTDAQAVDPAAAGTNRKVPIDNVTFYTRLGQRIIHILNTQTASGKLYEVDMRLRPSGNSGMLVSTLAAFERYQLKEAWTWEHQALVRARPVAGSRVLAEKFEQVRLTVLCQPRDLQKLRNDVRDMRRKMREQLGSEAKSRRENSRLFHLKQDAGGIVDIEFMVQYSALAWAHQAPKIVQYTDNIRILGSLEEAELLDATSVAQLIAAYKAYRSTGHRLALQQQEAILVGEHPFDTEREQVGQLWQQLIGAEVEPQQ